MAVLRFGLVELDEETGLAWTADGNPVDLTIQQRLLLQALLKARGSPLTHEQLAERVIREGSANPVHALQQCASDLRKRLRDAGVERDPIETLRNQAAYRIAIERARSDGQGETTFDPSNRTGPFDPRIGRRAPDNPLHIDPIEAISQLEREGAEERARGVAPRLSGRVLDRILHRYQQPGFARTLDKLRGELLTRESRTGSWKRAYPVAVFPNLTGQPLETVLPSAAVDAREGSAARPEAMAIRDPFPRLRRRLAANPSETVAEAERQTASGWNLAMTRLRREAGDLQLSARLAEYGLILDTCDALIDEACAATGDSAWPLRYAVERTDNPLESATRRAAGLGVAALITIVERDEDGSPVLRALVGRRSKNVGTYADTWHVAPAGMLNWRFGGPGPHEDDRVPWKGYEPEDVLRSVLTEYAEELRNITRMEQNTRRDYLDGLPAVIELKAHARFEFTGVALDLVNLRPEICVLIYVGDPAWDGPSRFRLNYEYQPLVAPTGRVDREPRRRELTPITVAQKEMALDDVALRKLDPAETVPSGAAAFWLGVDRAREIFAAELAGR